MLMPLKDAKFKYCPLLKTREDKFRMCLAGECMMWRFKHHDKRGEADIGYCGLAGRPAGVM